MYIILSQRRDFESQYNDKLFSVYHFPSRYRNQIHPGDKFIYYQGDRHSRELRYYYGTGRIGNVYQTGTNDYYAELTDCLRFKQIVPIYMEAGYFEQIDFQMVRKSPTPPWQSSIRPLSENAARNILEKSEGLIPAQDRNLKIILENELKSAMKKYYRDNNMIALNDVITSATQLAGLLGVLNDCTNKDGL